MGRDPRKRLHAAAGAAGFTIILIFWLGTVGTELLGSQPMIAAVKGAILWGMIPLIACLAAAGASGLALGRRRTDPPIQRKRRRMPVIALNGLLILVPSAFFLASRASAGRFDGWFYGIQTLELVAGATNLALLGLNLRDGLRASGRLRAPAATA